MVDRSLDQPDFIPCPLSCTSQRHVTVHRKSHRPLLPTFSNVCRRKLLPLFSLATLCTSPLALLTPTQNYATELDAWLWARGVWNRQSSAAPCPFDISRRSARYRLSENNLGRLESLEKIEFPSRCLYSARNTTKYKNRI
jgi:hypothetical protein